MIVTIQGAILFKKNNRVALSKSVAFIKSIMMDRYIGTLYNFEPNIERM